MSGEDLLSVRVRIEGDLAASVAVPPHRLGRPVANCPRHGHVCAASNWTGYCEWRDDRIAARTRRALS